MIDLIFYKEAYNELVVVEVNLYIDPPHDSGKYQLQSSDCRYTFSSEKAANQMGWIKIGKL